MVCARWTAPETLRKSAAVLTRSLLIPFSDTLLVLRPIAKFPDDCTLLGCKQSARNPSVDVIRYDTGNYFVA